MGRPLIEGHPGTEEKECDRIVAVRWGAAFTERESLRNHRNNEEEEEHDSRNSEGVNV